MHAFFDMIISQLNLYLMKKTSVISNYNTMVTLDINRSNLLSEIKSSTNSLKRTREYGQHLLPSSNCQDITTVTHHIIR